MTHMPDRWGFFNLSDKTVGQGTHSFKYPYNMGLLNCLLVMVYAAKSINYAKEKNYLRAGENFFLTDAEFERIASRS